MNKTRVLKYSFLKNAKDRTMVYNIEKYYLIFSQNNIFFVNSTLRMVPEIWSVTDRSFCHLGPFFAPLPPLNLKN